MIKTENGITEMEGSLVEIMADTALVMTNLYVISKDKLGEAGAREMIVDVGRVALADEMIARIEKKRTALGSTEYRWREVDHSERVEVLRQQSQLKNALRELEACAGVRGYHWRDTKPTDRIRRHRHDAGRD